jgi:hypothetical protein
MELPTEWIWFAKYEMKIQRGLLVPKERRWLPGLRDVGFASE